jgi:hypothetical protein
MHLNHHQEQFYHQSPTDNHLNRRRKKTIVWNHQTKSLPDSSQSLIEFSSNGVIKSSDGLARISQMLKVRRIEGDLSKCIDEFVCNFSSFIRRDSMV